MTSLLPRALATLLCVAVLSACTTGAAGPVAESPASIAPRPPLAELDLLEWLPHDEKVDGKWKDGRCKNN